MMQDEKKVLVTGADGMLGTMVCQELLSKNYLVKALVLNKDKAIALRTMDLELVEGNVLNKEQVERCLTGCSYVIHIAAITTFWPRKLRQVIDVNVTGTRHVMEMAIRNNIKRMVHIGTASSFSPGDVKHPGNENSEFTAYKYKSDYINSKYQAQLMLLEAHKKTGFPVIILNPTFMIGPYDSGPSSGIMIQAYYKNRIPGCSSGGKNFVYTGDVAKAVVNALTKGRTGQCYIVGNENLSYWQFLEKAAGIMKKKSKLLRFPAFLILLCGAWSSLMARISGTKPVLSYTMARIALTYQFYDSTKAVKELSLPQTPIETAIEESLNWFSENGYLK